MKMKTLLFALMTLPAFAAPPVDLKILTWNVYMLPKPIKWSIQGDRSKLIANALKGVDHDLILLQEAFTGNIRTQVGDALRETHPYQVSLGRSGYWKHVMPSGLFALSRYPMRMANYEYFNSCTKADCFASKGVMVLEVELPYAKKVHVAVTHMNAGSKQVCEDVRWSQLDQIIDATKALENEQTDKIPLILAGDLNIDGNSEEFNLALEKLNMTSTPLKNPEDPSAGYDVPCYKRSENFGPQWLDHILLNERATNSEVISKRIRQMNGELKGSNCALSDHQPVEATLRIYE